MYIPSLIKIGSGIQKVNGGGGFTKTQAAWWPHMRTFIIKKKEIKLKTFICVTTTLSFYPQGYLSYSVTLLQLQVLFNMEWEVKMFMKVEQGNIC
jgi:hypothetical protein